MRSDSATFNAENSGNPENKDKPGTTDLQDLSI